MKKLFGLFILMVLVSLSSQAQDLRLGMTYGGQIEKLGLQIGGQYGITNEIDLAAGLSWFFPDETSGGGVDVRSNFWMIDVDGHYNFDMGSGLRLYPLAGVNFTTARVKINSNSSSNSEIGLNIGGGAAFQLSDPLAAFAEIKYILGDADQAVFGFGILFSL